MSTSIIRNTPKAILTATILGIGAPVMAAIIGVLPDIVFSTPPNVGLDQTESDVEIKGFDEKQCIDLSYDLETDQGRILENTRFSCHFFHSDPVTSAVLVGRAQFDERIIGVISTSAGLDDSDVPCGLPTVIYPASGTEANRGLEDFQPNDYYKVSKNRRSIEIGTDVPSYSDQVRVLTVCYDWEG